MKSHRDHGAYVEFSLEGVAEILSSKFEDSHILVIRPARIELKTFSCFSNFVICNHIGTPTHEPNHNALLHLTTLLLSVAEQTGCGEIRDDSELIIIGFSKGCVVLNQLLHEFHYFYNLHMDSEINKTVLKQVKKLVWLDGGHSGGKNTWITSSSILSVLSRLSMASLLLGACGLLHKSLYSTICSNYFSPSLFHISLSSRYHGGSPRNALSSQR